MQRLLPQLRDAVDPPLRDRRLLDRVLDADTDTDTTDTDPAHFRAPRSRGDLSDDLPDELAEILLNAPSPTPVLQDHPQLRDPSTPYELWVNYAVQMAEASDQPLSAVVESEPVINYARSMGIDGDVYRRVEEP